MLINDDLPTFDRPINANSTRLSVGHFATSVLEMTNVAVFIFMGIFAGKDRQNRRTGTQGGDKEYAKN